VKTSTLLLLGGAAAVLGYLYVRRKNEPQVVARTMNAIEQQEPVDTEVLDLEPTAWGWGWAQPVWGVRSWGGLRHGGHGHHGGGGHGGHGRGGRR
jgi:hypothetical protein